MGESRTIRAFCCYMFTLRDLLLGDHGMSETEEMLTAIRSGEGCQTSSRNLLLHSVSERAHTGPSVTLQHFKVRGGSASLPRAVAIKGLLRVQMNIKPRACFWAFALFMSMLET
jgi:hypothetical protein